MASRDRRYRRSLFTALTSERHESDEHRTSPRLVSDIIVVVALAVMSVLTIAAGEPWWVPPAVMGAIGAFVAIAYLINDGTGGGGFGDGGGC